MKRRLSIILSIVSAGMIFMSCAQAGDDLGKERTQSFADVEKMFADPGKDFRPAPLWTWNANVTHADIDRMLADFKEQGFGGAFIHPRPGIETEYLSDEWFELWRYSVEKGKELGLDIWIYDENSYPSGFAGGHVQREMPESYDHPTDLHMFKVNAVPAENKDWGVCLKREGDEFIDITGTINGYRDVPGTYYLFENRYAEASPWTAGMPYVDLLYPGVTEKFIELTMSGYEKEFGRELGTVVKGTFSDEPHFLNWTPGMADEFKKDWGYDLLTHLPMMEEETGTNWKQVRYDFHYTKHRLFVENWAQPWDRYCRSHGLLWTGHYWDHEWPNINNVADNMAMYEYHHLPAVDMLFNNFDDKSPNAQWGNVRIIKELRSVANQMGYTRTLCESYGGAGWDLTFEDMKRLADWEYALGVNFMNQHYANVTIEGARKLDYPDFFTGYSPWSKDYKMLNDHVARLSLALSQGEQVNDILILEPTSTIWMYNTCYYRQDGMGYDIGCNFQEFITGLEKNQVEYDLGSESIIARHGKAKGGKFIVGERSYSTVIIPEMVETLFPETADLLSAFAKQGGTIIALSKPVLVNACESSVLPELWNSDADIRDNVILDELASDKVQFEEIHGNDLYHQCRVFDEGTLLYITNSSLTENESVKIRINGAGLKYLDTMTGEISAYTCSVNDDGTVSADIVLSPAGDILLFAPEKSADMAGLEVKRKLIATGKVLTPASETAVERLGDNYLTLDYCRYSIDGRISDEKYVLDACTDLYEEFGWYNPWERSIQYKHEFFDKDTLQTGPITVSYDFVVADDFDWSDMKFICEKPQLWSVSINGHDVEPMSDVHPLDARNGCYEIGKFVIKGTNTIRLRRETMSLFAEISYGFVSGDFSLAPTSYGWMIKAPVPMKTGPWTEQGIPFYSWDVAYGNSYEINDPTEGYLVKLGEWNGTVCEVLVNGEKAGIIGFKPYELDITPFIKEGTNTVEVICTGSLSSLFGPHFSPRHGLMDPFSWYGVDRRHGGDEYIFDKYGLCEPFSVIIASN